MQARYSKYKAQNFGSGGGQQAEAGLIVKPTVARGGTVQIHTLVKGGVPGLIA